MRCSHGAPTLLGVVTRNPLCGLQACCVLFSVEDEEQELEEEEQELEEEDEEHDSDSEEEEQESEEEDEEEEQESELEEEESWQRPFPFLLRIPFVMTP